MSGINSRVRSRRPSIPCSTVCARPGCRNRFRTNSTSYFLPWSADGTIRTSAFRRERSTQRSKAVTPPNFRLGLIRLYHPRGSSVRLSALKRSSRPRLHLHADRAPSVVAGPDLNLRPHTSGGTGLVAVRRIEFFRICSRILHVGAGLRQAACQLSRATQLKFPPSGDYYQRHGRPGRSLC